MAGSWTYLGIQKGNFNNAYSRPIGLMYEFTADAADGGIPDLDVTTSGYVFGIDVDFDGTTPPNELTMVMKTRAGNTQWSPTKLTASGWSKPDAPESAPGGFTLTAAQTVAKTNSAKGVITIHMG